MQTKIVTLYRGRRKWYQSRAAAFYSIAKALVLDRYPPWLDCFDEEQCNELADQHGIADWRARRDRAVEIFWDYNGTHFDPRRWQRFVRRVARFLAYVDRRNA